MSTPSQPPSNIPPGWFPIPGDASQERWWDGRQWTPHTRPAPVAMNQAETPTLKNAGRRWWWPVALVGGLALIIVIGLGIATSGRVSSSTAATSTSASPSQRTVKPISPEEQAQINAQNAARNGANNDQFEQTSMKGKGWTYFSDHLYYISAPANTISCGSTTCAGYSVVSMAQGGCPGGIMLEASFLADGNVSVGHGSSITAALDQGQQAVFKIYDYSGAGIGARVTSMRCLP